MLKNNLSRKQLARSIFFCIVAIIIVVIIGYFVKR